MTDGPQGRGRDGGPPAVPRAKPAEREAGALFIEAATAQAHRRLYLAEGRGRAGVERLAYAGPEMVVFFEQITERYRLARGITLIADNATHDRAAILRDWLARDGCRVRAVYLPPCAPNPHLIEWL